MLRSVLRRSPFRTSLIGKKIYSFTSSRMFFTANRYPYEIKSFQQLGNLPHTGALATLNGLPIGSTFYIGNQAALSAAHCFHPVIILKASFAPNTYVNIKDVFLHPAYESEYADAHWRDVFPHTDIAFIKLEDHPALPKPEERAICNFSPLKMECETVTVGYPAYFAPSGFALTQLPPFTKVGYKGIYSPFSACAGMLEQDPFYEDPLTASSSKGMSGGPVLNNKGEVIGISNASVALPTSFRASLAVALSSHPFWISQMQKGHQNEMQSQNESSPENLKEAQNLIEKQLGGDCDLSVAATPSRYPIIKMPNQRRVPHSITLFKRGIASAYSYREVLFRSQKLLLPAETVETLIAKLK